MNLQENIREGLRSINNNRLRAVLTALIIAFGITALIGILTTIDGIQSSVDNSFAGLGANTFDIRVQDERSRQRGIQRRKFPSIKYTEAKRYKELFGSRTTNSVVSISTTATGNAEVRYEQKKTNPNAAIIGVDENYLEIKGYKLQNGRNLTESDLRLGSHTVVIGSELATKLFPRESPLGKYITAQNEQFQVVGVLDKKGSVTGGGDDRVLLVPIEVARQVGAGRSLTYDITTSIAKMTDLEYVMGEATSIMRIVRGDRLGQPDSFVIERSDSLAKNFSQVTDYLRIGGFGISFITLLGAAIALMNIMMVSVTERTREIGIRKALGATPTKIRIQFLIEAIVICILGGLTGIVVGITVGNVVSKVISDNASFIIPWGWMSLGLIVCISVGLFSGLYPAYRASRLDPIESLRYE